jgi:hypothetical protein
MMATAFIFEVQSIQFFIFASGKMRDASGASELINSLCADAGRSEPSATGLAERLREQVLPDSRVYRSTGGVLDLVHPGAETDVHSFRALFRLLVARAAPGLAFADGVGTADDEAGARAAARADMQRSAAFPGWPGPLGSPLVRPAPRSSGSPAVVSGWTSAGTGQCRITGEYADLPSLARRQHLARGSRALADQFLPMDCEGYRWPGTFEDDLTEGGDRHSEAPVLFPFRSGEVPRIALIHADGNGMGQMFMEAGRSLLPDQIRLLSFRLAMANRHAAMDAMKPVTAFAADGVIPARPILLGGDDITIILRADLAIRFVYLFATAFEDKATAAVRSLLPAHPRVTAKVGVVILGPRQPFARAYDLCSSLASSAKVEGQSTAGLCRITTSVFPEGAQDLIAQGRTAGGCQLWRPSHGLGELRKLAELAELLGNDAVGHGALRRVPEVMKTDYAAAEAIYKRALEMVRKRDAEVHQRLVAALAGFGMRADSLPKEGYCPLLDAHDFAQFGGATEEEEAA